MTVAATLAVLMLILVAGTLMAAGPAQTDLDARNLSPGLGPPLRHRPAGPRPLARTFAGLRLSLCVGALAAGASAVIALVLGAAAGASAGGSTRCRLDGRPVLAMPHLVLMILLAFVRAADEGGGDRRGHHPLAGPHPGVARRGPPGGGVGYVAVFHRLGRSGPGWPATTSCPT